MLSTVIWYGPTVALDPLVIVIGVPATVKITAVLVTLGETRGLVRPQENNDAPSRPIDVDPPPVRRMLSVLTVTMHSRGWGAAEVVSDAGDAVRDG